MDLGVLMLAQAANGGAFGNPFILLPAILLIMYLMVIRPQQKQLKEHKALVGALKKGDEVVTQGGILGKIHAVTDKFVTLEVAANVRIRVLKTSIQGRVTGTEEAVAALPAKAEEKKEGEK